MSYTLSVTTLSFLRPLSSLLRQLSSIQVRPLQLTDILCPPYLPLYICDAHFLTRLLVIVEPLALIQLNGSELGPRLGSLGLEFTLDPISSPHYLTSESSAYIGFELDEFQSSAIELEYVHRLGRIGLVVCDRCCLDVRIVFSLLRFSVSLIYRGGVV